VRLRQALERAVPQPGHAVVVIRLVALLGQEAGHTGGVPRPPGFLVGVDGDLDTGGAGRPFERGPRDARLVGLDRVASNSAMSW
jgi:hypothetical protein